MPGSSRSQTLTPAEGLLVGSRGAVATLHGLVLEDLWGHAHEDQRDARGVLIRQVFSARSATKHEAASTRPRHKSSGDCRRSRR